MKISGAVATTGPLLLITQHAIGTFLQRFLAMCPCMSQMIFIYFALSVFLLCSWFFSNKFLSLNALLENLTTVLESINVENILSAQLQFAYTTDCSIRDYRSVTFCHSMCEQLALLRDPLVGLS